MDPGWLSSILIEFSENAMLGESQVLADGALLIGFVELDAVAGPTSVHSTFWVLDAVVILALEEEHDVAQELLELGDMDGIL